MAGNSPLEPWTITRRAVGPNDVSIDIKWAGICHSDIHMAREEWSKGKPFPMVPGHEISGVVLAVGSDVASFEAGDAVGVGVFVDSCRACAKCREGKEQYCTGGGKVLTYAAEMIYDHQAEKGGVTYGGYSQRIVVDANYVVRIPASLDLAEAAPLLCAGITVWSPLMFYGAQARSKIGVAGLGGLGHMAVKFAAALGAEVTVFSRSEAKRAEACARLGAHHFVVTTDAEACGSAAGSLDLIIDTISADHDVDQLLGFLKNDGGNLCMVGLPPSPLSIKAGGFVGPRKMISGSNIGGIRETQDMLDFCGRHKIACDVERIQAADINAAYDRCVASDVKYRFVIDASTM